MLNISIFTTGIIINYIKYKLIQYEYKQLLDML